MDRKGRRALGMKMVNGMDYVQLGTGMDKRDLILFIRMEKGDQKLTGTQKDKNYLNGVL